MQAAEDAESIYSESLEEDSEGEDIEAPILSAAAFSSEFETKFMQWIDDYALLDELGDMIALPSGGSAVRKPLKAEQHLATAQEATESLEKRDMCQFEGVEETARHSCITGVKRSHDQLVTEDESEACVACADGSDVRLVVNRDHAGHIVIFPERLLVDHYQQFEQVKRKIQSNFGDTPRFVHQLVQCIYQLEHRCTYGLDRVLQQRFGMKKCFSEQLVAACVEASSAGAQWTVAWDTKQGVRAVVAPALGNHVLVQQVQDLYPSDTMLARYDCRGTERRVKTVQKIVEQHPELTCLLTSHVASATQQFMKKSKTCVEREEVEESAPTTQQFSSESAVAVVEEGDLFVALEEDAADSEEGEPTAEPSVGDQAASTAAAESRSVRRLTVTPSVHHPTASAQHLSADWTETCVKDKGVKRGHTLPCVVRDECISVCASWAWKKYQLPEQIDLLLGELVDIGTFAPVAVEDDGRMTFLFADLVLVLLVFGVIAKADEPSVMTVMANVPEWRAFDTQKSDARLRVRKTLLQKHAGLTEYGYASVNDVSGKQLRVVYYEPA